MRTFRWFYPLIVCLAFTGGHVAWADRATPDFYIEDPYAPHRTVGSTARLGTAVGFLYHEAVNTTAVGADVGMGYRFGRLAVEAEYKYLALQVRGPDSTPLGNGQRLAALARFDVLRLGSRVVGGNSMFAVYVEGGAGPAWNRWYKPAYFEQSRLIPVDTKRIEGQLGFGVYIDHRLQEPIGFPHRVAWYMGWRMTMSPHTAPEMLLCRGVTCAKAPMMDEPRTIDRSMLFQSSLQFTF